MVAFAIRYRPYEKRDTLKVFPTRKKAKAYYEHEQLGHVKFYGEKIMKVKKRGLRRNSKYKIKAKRTRR